MENKENRIYYKVKSEVLERLLYSAFTIVINPQIEEPLYCPDGRVMVLPERGKYYISPPCTEITLRRRR